MDQSLGRYEWLWAGGATDSGVLKIAPRTLAMLSNAIVAPVAHASWMRSPEPTGSAHFLPEA